MTIYRKSYLPKSFERSDSSFWPMGDRLGSIFDSWLSEVNTPATKIVSDFSPQIEVKEDKQNYFVDVELPGIKAEEVELGFKDKVLSIKGHRKNEYEESSADKKTHYSERFYGSFMRTIPFAEDILDEKIDAEYKNGILKVKLPKKPTDTPVNKKIAIKT